VVARPPVIVVGLGVVLRAGVRAWMEVCRTSSPDRAAAPPRDPAPEGSVEAQHWELVAIWAQMATAVSAEVVHG
jgi:predicted RNA-binding protein with PUA-like domain